MNRPVPNAVGKRRLSELLDEGCDWSALDRLELWRRVALQVRELHEAGQVHRSVDLEHVRVDRELRPELVAASGPRRFGADSSDPDYCPPELADREGVDLPADVNEATALLQSSRSPLDPRRIDVYQLGTLLCRLMTGESVLSYMYSPTAKGKVPEDVRPLVDRALGHDAAQRFADCDPLISAVDGMIGERTAGEDTPAGYETPSLGSVVAGPSDTSAPGIPPAPAAPDRAAQSGELPFERLGHFQIVEPIGRGGMGDVYKGYDESLRRHVAVKVLPAELARDEDFVRRFHDEATAAAKIAHPNIVPVYFSGQDSGHHFFAMQLVEGESLAERLGRCGSLSTREALEIGEQCLAGLGAAHGQGLIHRDVKPGNILMESGSGRALLVDFGLVRTIGRTTRITATGTIMGTVDYIAPEQARGLPIDGRSDIYSLGILLYELLAGRLPFEAESPTAMIFQHAYEQPLPLGQAAPDVPEPVQRIVARMMAKSPDDRYPHCAAALADVQAFLAGRPLEIAAPEQGESTPAATAVVPAPEPQDDVRLPKALKRIVSPTKWQRACDWAGTMFRRHAPEAVKQLQGTSQQVDGAVAEYERRRRRLKRLLAEARAIASDLSEQSASNHQAARQAARRVESATDDDTKQAALAQQRLREEDVARLEAQTAGQLQQIDQIELQLAKADATLVKLRSQRDLLKTRLLAAEARWQLDEGRPRRRYRRWPALVAAVAVLAAAIGVAILMIVSGRDREASPGSVFARTDRGRLPTVSADVPESVANRETIVNSIGMKLVHIPAGEFTMGTPKSEMDMLMATEEAKHLLDEEHGPNECPAHQVTISRPFYMGTYEVTQDEFVQVMDRNPSRYSPSAADTSQYPVDYVAHKYARDFCQQLSKFPEEKAAGRTYRLPTEAEWEYACRAGTTGAFEYRDRSPHDPPIVRMNCFDPTRLPAHESSSDRNTTIIGLYPCNAFGLYDMHGNVWEWCSDGYQADFYGESPSTDPTGPHSRHATVIRGGAFDVPPILCRSAFRGHAVDTTDALGAIGFRVVCEIETPDSAPIRP